MAPAIMYWDWEAKRGHLREIVTEFTIHNDVGNWADQHGHYLFLVQNHISDVLFYVGLQTNAKAQEPPYWRGKGVVFSRWGTRDLANAKYSETDGWAETAGHEGDFIGVRRSYDWGVGDYRVRISPDGLESDGEWFSVWITDLGAGDTTWIGSLKFPLVNGTAAMKPNSLATVEVYGIGPIRPIDIPQWHVSVKRPLGDNELASRGLVSYPWDESDNALFNSNLWFDHLEDRAHLVVGGTTERKTSQEWIFFE